MPDRDRDRGVPAMGCREPTTGDSVTGVRFARSAVLSLALTGCGQGSVEVVLRLPTAEGALPVDATQIVLRADRVDGDPITLTAPIRDGAFELGELPVDDYGGMTVELRGANGGTVGYGRTSAALAVGTDGNQLYEIPVRRPRTYVAGPTPEETIDAPETVTRPRVLRIDRGGAAIITEMVPLAASQAGAVLASAGPDLFLAAGAMVFRLDSSTDVFDPTPIMTTPAPIVDLTGSPDGAFLVAGAGSTMHLLELATGTVRTVTATGPIGAVTLGRETDGSWAAIALVNAARTSAQCARQSSLLITPLVAAEAGTRTLALGGGVADIAGTTARPFVVAAELCGHRATVVELGPDTITAITPAPVGICSGTAKDVLCAPTAVAASADQAWIGGTVPSVIGMQPDPGGPFPYTATGAHHQLATVDLTAAPRLARVAELPELQQTLDPTSSMGFVINRNMKAHVATVAALSVSADGSVLTLSSNSMAKATGLTFGLTPFIPAIALHVSYQLSISTQTGAVEASLRTRCVPCENERDDEAGFELGQRCVLSDTYIYPTWACAPNTGGEPAQDFEGGSSSALFGRP